MSAFARLKLGGRDLFGEAYPIAERIRQHPLHVDRNGSNGPRSHGRRGSVDEEQDGREETDAQRHPGQRREAASRIAAQIAPDVTADHETRPSWR